MIRRKRKREQDLLDLAKEAQQHRNDEELRLLIEKWRAMQMNQKKLARATGQNWIPKPSKKQVVKDAFMEELHRILVPEDFTSDPDPDMMRQWYQGTLRATGSVTTSSHTHTALPAFRTVRGGIKYSPPNTTTTANTNNTGGVSW